MLKEDSAASPLFETRLNGVMIIVFISTNILFKMMNKSTMIHCRRVSWVNFELLKLQRLEYSDGSGLSRRGSGGGGGELTEAPFTLGACFSEPDLSDDPAALFPLLSYIDCSPNSAT